MAPQHLVLSSIRNPSGSIPHQRIPIHIHLRTVRHFLKQSQHRRRRVPAQTRKPKPKYFTIQLTKTEIEREREKWRNLWRREEISSSLMKLFFCFLVFSVIVVVVVAFLSYGDNNKGMVFIFFFWKSEKP